MRHIKHCQLCCTYTLDIVQPRLQSVCMWYPATFLHMPVIFIKKSNSVIELLYFECCEIVQSSLYYSGRPTTSSWELVQILSIKFRFILFPRHVYIDILKKFCLIEYRDILELCFFLSVTQKILIYSCKWLKPVFLQVVLRRNFS